MKQLTKSQKITGAIAGAMATVGTLGSTAMLSFAASSDVAAMLKTAIGSVAGVLTTVFPSICILVLAICMIFIILGRSSKSAEVSTSWAKRAVIGFLVFNCLGTLMNYAGTLFQGHGIETVING